MYLFSKYCFQVSHHLQLILYFVVDAITIKLHIMINGSFMPAILCYIQFGNINVSHDHIFLRQFLCKKFLLFVLHWSSVLHSIDVLSFSI